MGLDQFVHDMGVVLFVGPPIWVLFGWMGRKVQRFLWQYDLPYDERVRGLKPRSERKAA